MKTQFFLFGRKTDLYFHDFTPAIKRNEKSDKDGDVDYKIRRQKTIEKELDCELRIFNPDFSDYHIFKEIDIVHRHFGQNIINKHNKFKEDAEKDTLKKYYKSSFCFKYEFKKVLMAVPIILMITVYHIYN